MDYELCRGIYAAGGMSALRSALDGLAPQERTEAVLTAARVVGDTAARDLARSRVEAEKRQVDMEYWKIMMPLGVDAECR
ncbi:hypothetical protein [Streptomyces halstedii]|uniref:hypothetical protein n=1 Tax=Streptomyces halstedii TaxID=1944 RepID=UPI00381EBC75